MKAKIWHSVLIYPAQQFMFVGGKHKRRKKEENTRRNSLKSLFVCVCTLLLTQIPPTVSFHVRLTFSLADGWGPVGRACVCVAFAALQTPPTTSGTGVRAPSVNAPSFPGLVSAAASTARGGRTEGVWRCGCNRALDFKVLCNCSESALKWRWR